MFCEIELITQKKSFYKNIRVSNAKHDVILRNSISLLQNSVVRTFRSSDFEITSINTTILEEFHSSYKQAMPSLAKKLKPLLFFHPKRPHTNACWGVSPFATMLPFPQQ